MIHKQFLAADARYSAVLPIARPIPSICLEHPEHCENGELNTYLLWGDCRKSCLGYLGDPSPHMTTPSPKLGVGNPQSKLASQIAAKWYQIQGWFVLTAYGILPAPYPTVRTIIGFLGAPLSPKLG